MKNIEQYKRISMVKECIHGKHCDDCDHCITDDNIRYFCKLNLNMEVQKDEH